MIVTEGVSLMVRSKDAPKLFIQQNYLKNAATLRKINIGSPTDRNIIIYFFHCVVKLISFTRVVFILKLRVVLS